MGSRSEVAIKCGSAVYDVLRDICCKVGLPPDEIYKDGSEYIFHWDCVKWDSYYDDAAAIEKVLDTLDEFQKSSDYSSAAYGYRFIRLGEDDGDTEIRENYSGISLGIIRTIDIPEGLEEIKEAW